MAIVSSFGPKVDAAAIVQCFVPEGLFTVYLTMACRLQTHGILKWNTDERLVMGLEGRELAVFLTVLPFVEYDYRLAYLVAQECETGSDALRQTKIQLVAVINSGGINIFDFDDESLGDDTPSPLHHAVNGCTGYSKPLSDQGNMWLALGLWNQFGRSTCSFTQVNMFSKTPLPGVSGLSASANMALCLKADRTWADISSALATCGVETVRKGFTEESELSADECNEIQKHLFKAYVSQLCSCVKQNNTIELLDISSKRTINGFLRWSEYAISFDNIPEDKPAFGVYHSLVRDKTEVNFRDWTMIPGRIVATWANEFRDRVGQPGLEIESMLRTDGSPRQNYDGIKGEAWEAPDW
ncbi:hypothetical protein NW760_008332 [Fusarium oxysporum]|nr:hypothetical protein NW769_003141 [Fusarium oxysporum]KAJ4227626.1 hypothetical protein NW760_008332 [Fusarium oxysporum]